MRNKRAREIRRLSRGDGVLNNKGMYNRNKKTYLALNQFDRKKFMDGLKNSTNESIQ